MSSFDLLNTVQPASGWFAIAGINSNGIKQVLVQTRKEADALAAQFVAQRRNVFFGVAKYKTDKGRTKDNVLSLRAFWLDIDCGESKAVVNTKTGKPGGYIDQLSGFSALQSFCKLIGLPKPTVVNSGRGLHVYWPLDRDVTREEWEPVAERLRDLCITHDLYVDPVVFECARILRIPGTYNFKDSPATEVTVVVEGKPVDFDDFVNLLGVPDLTKTTTYTPSAPRPLTALGQSLQENIASSFSKIMQRSANGDGCQQLLDCYNSRDSLNEGRWFDALSVAKFCKDKDKAIHKLSAGHPDYDPDKTEQKIAHIKGPHTCVTFDRNNPGGCTGCPYSGKVKSPIVLGREVVAAETNEVERVDELTGEKHRYIIPDLPFPFVRGKNGGIYHSLGEEAEPVLVLEQDFYVVKVMRDPDIGDVALFRYHTTRNGVREFTIPHRNVTDKAELRKTLASHSVLASSEKGHGLLFLYVVLSLKKLFEDKEAEKMRLQFGWADNDSKFIVGQREVTKDGIFHSPPSHVTEPIAQYMGPVGSLEKWKEVFALYGKPGLEPHAFAALTAFGAPLFKFLGQRGAMINVIHPDSGTGKTTILHMCNSVWGNPERLCATKEDTTNSKIMKLGIYNNLPFVVDEITNTAPLAFSDLIYAMSNGKGKDRMKASGNELRTNNTTWQTISLCSSNASFYEKLALLKGTPDGEMMRLLEYKIEATNTLDPAFAKEMFDHQLMNNYGHAGLIYAKWLVDELEEAKNGALGIQAKIDAELKLTPRERFWSAVVASNIAGGLAIKKLGLIDWDMRRIYDWACSMLMDLRKDVAPPASAPAAIIGDYLNRHMQNILIVNDAVDSRTNMQQLPQQEPKGELLIRFEPDTKLLFVVAGAFKADCVENQINYKETLKKLKEQGVYVKADSKRMSKGMSINSPPVHAIYLDTSAAEFLSVENLLPEAVNADAGRGS